MIIAAIVIMAVGSLGVGAAVVLEIIYHEPVYKVLMKVFPWVFGIGAILLAIGLGGS